MHSYVVAEKHCIQTITLDTFTPKGIYREVCSVSRHYARVTMKCKEMLKLKDFASFTSVTATESGSLHCDYDTNFLDALN